MRHPHAIHPPKAKYSWALREITHPRALIANAICSEMRERLGGFNPRGGLPRSLGRVTQRQFNILRDVRALHRA